MCHLMTLGVPNPVAPDLVGRELHLEEFVGQGSGHVYGRDLHVYSLTSGGCSCSLVNVDGPDEDLATQQAKALREYQRKNWSEAKIQRAMAERFTPRPSAPPLHRDVARILLRLLEDNERVEMIVHSHRGRYDTESFALKGKLNIDASSDIEVDPLLEDVRYIFRRPSR